MVVMVVRVITDIGTSPDHNTACQAMTAAAIRNAAHNRCWSFRAIGSFFPVRESGGWYNITVSRPSHGSQGNPAMEHSLPAHVDLKKLREIFAAVAKRRIRNEVDAEEIVQEALATVLEKSAAQEYEKSFLQWAFGVLRNKIGNYYQKRDRRIAHEGELDADEMRTLADATPDPQERFAETS
jgi:hypothetical protein